MQLLDARTGVAYVRAQFPGWCVRCRTQFQRGAKISKADGKGWVCGCCTGIEAEDYEAFPEAFGVTFGRASNGSL
jgi:hypothetical protein